MQRLGLLLIVTGFLAGSYVAVLDEETVAVGPYLLALGIGILGAALVILSKRQASRQTDVLATNIETAKASLDTLVAKAEALEREQDEIGVYGLSKRIDEDFPEALDAFVQARKSLAHRYGLSAYASVMNPFAAGERYLNRVWSTSIDGYIDEATTYVTAAKEQLTEARDALAKMTAA